MREAQLEQRQEAERFYWRCVPCDLTHDGKDVELHERGARCPDCGRELNYDERTKK